MSVATPAKAYIPPLIVGIIYAGLPLAGTWLDAALSLPRFSTDALSFLGLALMASCVVVAVWSIALLSVVGRGTPSPWAPPVRLVRVGPFRRTRNPIFLAVVAFEVGAAAFTGSVATLGLTALLFLGLHAYLVRVEEPALRRRFAGAYEAYASRVPRWL